MHLLFMSEENEMGCLGLQMNKLLWHETMITVRKGITRRSVIIGDIIGESKYQCKLIIMRNISLLT